MFKLRPMSPLYTTSSTPNMGYLCPSFPPPLPTVSGLQQRCQESEVPVEVPAGELSQLQVHVLQPAVSQAEAQELRQVRSPSGPCVRLGSGAAHRP